MGSLNRSVDDKMMIDYVDRNIAVVVKQCMNPRQLYLRRHKAC